MHFGKTHADKQQIIIQEILDGRREFALLPSQLEDGSYVWLEHYYSYPEVVAHYCNGGTVIKYFVRTSRGGREVYRNYKNKLPNRVLPIPKV